MTLTYHQELYRQTPATLDESIYVEESHYDQSLKEVMDFLKVVADVLLFRQEQNLVGTARGAVVALKQRWWQTQLKIAFRRSRRAEEGQWGFSPGTTVSGRG